MEITQSDELGHPKYAVLKWSDWQGITEEIGDTPEEIAHLDGLLLDDAEVIRAQDITSGPVFHTYTSIMLTYRDLLTDPDSLDSANLLRIADHFAQAADEADELRAKGHARLPT